MCVIPYRDPLYSSYVIDNSNRAWLSSTTSLLIYRKIQPLLCGFDCNMTLLRLLELTAVWVSVRRCPWCWIKPNTHKPHKAGYLQLSNKISVLIDLKCSFLIVMTMIRLKISFIKHLEHITVNGIFISLSCKEPQGHSWVKNVFTSELLNCAFKSNSAGC